SHAAEDAHGESDFLSGIPFVKMHAALHHGYGDGARFANHHLSGVADGGGAREGRDIGVGDSGRIGQGIGEAAEAGAEDETDLRTYVSPMENGLRSGFGEGEMISHKSRV